METDGKVYVRIPLTADTRAVADFSYTFDKRYADYWEAVFQKVGGIQAEYFSAVATRGETYLIVAVTPGDYNVLVLAGVSETGRRNGKKILLASGYAPNQTVLHGRRQDIQVPMSLHTVRVRPYEGVAGGDTSAIFLSDKVGDEQQVFAPGIEAAYLADFIYNAEISNIGFLLQADPSLAGHLLNPEIFAYAGGTNMGTSLFTAPAPSVAVALDKIQFHAGIPKSSIPSGEYMTSFNVRYYAFGQSASGQMTEWNLRRGITNAANDPMGGAVRICFMEQPMATGGLTRFNRNADGSFDELHIFKTANNLVSAVSPFEVIRAPDPATANALIVAGGGGGGPANVSPTLGGGYKSAGGGAGGLLKPTNIPLSVGQYSVAVGGGGIGGDFGSNPNRGKNGQNSSITGLITYIAIGGGGGGQIADYNGGEGASGGSGGGGYLIGGAETPGQGKKGGSQGGGTGPIGAGGGGFNGQGGDGSNGNGGAGIDRDVIPAVTGIPVLVPEGFAGGGSGGGGPSGSHGGGNGSTATDPNPALRSGQPHTGGGGAGANALLAGAAINGYDGGSGIVVIRFRYIP
jgi:hypothetical protein